MEVTFNIDENIVQIGILFDMEKWGKLLLLDFFIILECTLFYW